MVKSETPRSVESWRGGSFSSWRLRKKTYGQIIIIITLFTQGDLIGIEVMVDAKDNTDTP